MDVLRPAHSAGACKKTYSSAKSLGFIVDCLLNAGIAMAQDPVDGLPAVLVQRYNITQQKQLELQLSLQQEALQRSAALCMYLSCW